MIENLLDETVVAVNVEARDWRDAVRKGGQLLVKAGKAKESYVNSMIETVEKTGPYIVIAPGVAMPHARPEKGALDIGVSLLFLREPVLFGNVDNDPVSIVISLSAKGNDDHLDLLADIMKLLEDNEFLALAKKHASKVAVLDYISEHFR
jgi:PTS system ascorbate-specific IIA component